MMCGYEKKTGTRPISICIVAALLVVATSGARPAGADVSFDKAFQPATIGPGSTSRLVFKITNGEPTPLTDLAFSDVLPAGVTIATPANASMTCGTTLSAPDGDTTISFAGESRDGVGSFETCTISVDVTSSTEGTATNVSGDLTSSRGNHGTATADLTVASDRPGFTKVFSPSATTYGSTVTLDYVIDNTANASPALNLMFTDSLPTGLTVASPANASTTCTGGSLVATPGESTISYGTQASVAASSSCTVSVDVVAGAVGTLDSVSGDLTSTPDFITPVSSGMASAALVVTASTGAPVLTKSFIDDPAKPGGDVTLEFSIFNPDRDYTATSITFVDDLDATLPGLMAVSLPESDFCGAGSQMTGSSLLILSGASLAPGASCTFSVTLAVPFGTSSGSYTNTTTGVTATVNGRGVGGDPASNDLTVDADSPQITTTFTTNPVGAGGPVTMEFTITAQSSAGTATDIAFTEELTPPFAFPIAFDTLPSVPCGAGSSLSAIFFGEDRQGLALAAGSLPESGSCTFEVSFAVPADTPSGSFPVSTNPITATVGGSTVTGGTATDTLQVVGASLQFTAEFIDDPVGPLEAATLQFSLANTSEAGDAISGISFTDDLTATLAGLVATGLPVDDVCGAGSQITGTASLSVTGGSLSAGGSCTFSVVLTVPEAATPGSLANTTSLVTGTVGGLDVASPAATAELLIKGLALAKSFTDDPVMPGATVTLEFTIENQTADLPATNIVFQDNLSGVLSGLTVVPGSFPAEPCGAGSSIILAGGDTLLIVTGGTLAAGASCSFSVTLQVPVGTTPDTFASATSGFTGVLAGSTVIFPNASDHLVVAFAPNDQCIEATIVTGDGSRRFTDTVDTLLATAEEDDPTPDCGTGPDGATVWYSYTPTTDGTTPIATEGSDYDTVVSVWQGSEGCESLVTQVACNDDDGQSPQSWLEFASEAETHYLIQVGARNMGEGGDLVVAIPEPPHLLYSVFALATLGLVSRRRLRQPSGRSSLPGSRYLDHGLRRRGKILLRGGHSQHGSR
jgi:uncharacterized repeat protein (TIGR01451 family)